ncbi:MAG: tetratricopeptide repeat protein, partial [Acidobacteriota bacterium]
LQALFQSCKKGKLLVTSRYPLPGAEDWLAREELGPLSAAQTRKLFLRLPRLREQEPESLQLVQRVIGGHPRMLEYLDGILNQGRARLPAVTQRLRQQSEEQGIDLSVEGRELDQAVQEALQVGAGDILLDELLEVVGREEGDLEVLDQVAVFPMPVPLEGLSLALAGVEGGEESPAALQVAPELRQAVRRLASSSLLTRLGEGLVWVHRWTAEALRARRPESAYVGCCRRAGEYMMWRIRHQTRSIHDGIEPTRLFLSAQHFDRAAEVGGEVLGFLTNYGRRGDLASLAAEIADSLPEQHPQRPAMLGREADALASLGLTDPALEKLRQSVEGLESLVQLHPSESDYQHDLSASYQRLGDLLRALGQGEEARHYYEKQFEIRKRLASQEPGRSDYQRDLSVSYNKLGDLLRSLGQGEEARSHYQNSLEIAERLACQEPGCSDYQRDLSVSYNKLGDLLGALGQGEEARSYYQKSLEIRERLASQEPGRSDYQRDLSVAYERLGDFLREAGKENDAMAFFQKALNTRDQLAQQEPQRADLQLELIPPLTRTGRREDAERALAILKRLDSEGRLPPSHANWIEGVEKLLQNKS